MKTNRALPTVVLAVGAVIALLAWPRHGNVAEASARPAASKSTRVRAQDPAMAGVTVLARDRVDSGTNFQDTLREIEDATVEYSATELPKFEKWLKSPNPLIRAEAADGLLRSGLPGGAPLLRAAAAVSKDPAEAATYERSASILELPPETDLMVKALQSDPERKPLPHYKRPVPGDGHTATISPDE